MSAVAGIYTSSDDLLDRLAQACPEWTFEATGEARERALIAVVDGEEPVGSRSMTRLILDSSGDSSWERRAGEWHLGRIAFLLTPASFLAFASELADAAVHAEQLELEANYLRQIHELMTLVDAEAVSERITTTVLELFGLVHGTLFLHDPRFERYMVSFSNDPAYVETGEFLPGIPADALQEALASATRFAVVPGMIVMPLQVGEDLLGVIKVALAPGETLDGKHAAVVTRYLAAVAQVLSNIYQLTRSRDLAMRDDLTKSYNRRFFETYLDEEIERSRRYGTVFTIIFLDLDDLRQVNNVHGHLAGSRTLQEVAKRILSAVRGIDKVVRFGGDEFCVILPQTDEEQALAVTRRISRSITASPLQIDPHVEVTITASFGIASYPKHAMSKDALIRQADAAMYRVKSTTKNAVGVATVEDATRPVGG